MKTAYLLVNLGTPEELSVKAVRKYLKEFLLDPYVIDIPWVFRQILVRGIIAPFRAPKSFEAYSEIWTDKGSPLLLHSRDLQNKLNEVLEEKVFLAMRYGEPSIEGVIKKIESEGYERVICLPMYPHYALSTTETVKQKVLSVVSKLNKSIEIDFINPYFDDVGFINSLTASIKPYVDEYEHILFSYHGLPERHITKLDKSRRCLTKDCCKTPGERIEFCYRAQCLFTTGAVIEKLGLSHKQYTSSFQSRLGKGWLTPYTDEVIVKLAKTGRKRIAVVCPAFSSDCLETLEEIQIQGEELFKENGGEKLTLVPCLNSNADWLEVIKKLFQQKQKSTMAPRE